MARTGRKTFEEELKIRQRYADLSIPYFKFLKKSLEGEEKSDQKWAVEQLSKAFVKMIPQETDVTTQGDKIQFCLPSEIIDKNDEA